MTEYEIAIASTNTGKVREITKTLQDVAHCKILVKGLNDYDLIISEPDEPYESFIENATHKAKYYANFLNTITLSDDSGLCIEALEGFPGVRTKEFVQECGGIQNTFLKLEGLLSNQNNYKAYFISAAVMYIPKLDVFISHEAKDHGIITFPPRGNSGFAFDPIFIPNGYNQTFAELSLEEKNKISHRAKAMQGLMEKFHQFLNI